MLMYNNAIYIDLIMNKLADIRNKYNVTNKELAILFNVHPNTISNMLDKELTTLPLNYIKLLRDKLEIPYNDLIGEKIFTPSNIDNTIKPNRSFIGDPMPIELIDEPESMLHPADLRVIKKIIDEKLKRNRK